MLSTDYARRDRLDAIKRVKKRDIGMKYASNILDSSIGKAGEMEVLITHESPRPASYIQIDLTDPFRFSRANAVLLRRVYQLAATSCCRVTAASQPRATRINGGPANEKHVGSLKRAGYMRSEVLISDTGCLPPLVSLRKAANWLSNTTKAAQLFGL